MKSLQRGIRVTAVMACATGKTLIALWVAEELHAKTILVLVPSIILIKQCLHAWIDITKHTSPQITAYHAAMLKGAWQFGVSFIETDLSGYNDRVLEILNVLDIK